MVAWRNRVSIIISNAESWMVTTAGTHGLPVATCGASRYALVLIKFVWWFFWDRQVQITIWQHTWLDGHQGVMSCKWWDIWAGNRTKTTEALARVRRIVLVAKPILECTSGSSDDKVQRSDCWYPAAITMASRISKHQWWGALVGKQLWWKRKGNRQVKCIQILEYKMFRRWQFAFTGNAND